jgi:hypothetical protein
MLSLRIFFRAPSVSSHSARPRAVTKCQDKKALIRDRDFPSQVSHLLVSRTFGSRNAKMAQHSLLRGFCFAKSGCKGYPCTLGSPVTEKVKYLKPILLGFRVSQIRMHGMSLLLRTSGRRKAEMPDTSRFWDFVFREIRIQRVSLLLGVSGRRKSMKCPMPINFRILSFREIRVQRVSLLLGVSGRRKAKMPKC